MKFQYTLKYGPEIKWALGVFFTAMVLQYMKTPDVEIYADPGTWVIGAGAGALRVVFAKFLGKSSEQPAPTQFVRVGGGDANDHVDQHVSMAAQRLSDHYRLPLSAAQRVARGLPVSDRPVQPSIPLHDEGNGSHDYDIYLRACTACGEKKRQGKWENSIYCPVAPQEINPLPVGGPPPADL